jgi:hypothetical protein
MSKAASVDGLHREDARALRRVVTSSRTICMWIGSRLGGCIGSRLGGCNRLDLKIGRRSLAPLRPIASADLGRAQQKGR